MIRFCGSECVCRNSKLNNFGSVRYASRPLFGNAVFSIILYSLPAIILQLKQARSHFERKVNALKSVIGHNNAGPWARTEFHSALALIDAAFIYSSCTQQKNEPTSRCDSWFVFLRVLSGEKVFQLNSLIVINLIIRTFCLLCEQF